MDRQQTGVILSIKALGLEFKIKDFEDRLILQKAIYLAQAAGVNLGYQHQWYVHGPYCSALTRDAYAMKSDITMGIDDSDTWKLDDQSAERLSKLKDIIPVTERPRQLEVLACVHFLVERDEVVPDTAPLYKALQKLKKNFIESEISGALGALKAHGLLPN